MAIGAPETEGLAGTAYQSELPDAQILRRAIRKSIHTSSEAFLKTVEEVDNCGTGYWEQEIRFRHLENRDPARGADVVGVAVAKIGRTQEKDRDIDPPSTRFHRVRLDRSGSPWHDHLGERLVRFLFAVECARSPDIRQFLLLGFREKRLGHPVCTGAWDSCTTPSRSFLMAVAGLSAGIDIH